MMDYEPYRQAIKKKVCEHCVDLGEDGRCALTSDRKCGIETHLERIIDVVQVVRGGKMEDYLAVLRANVCSVCENSSPDGSCQLRIHADCGLDRFFELVIEAIDEVDNAA